jgi:hypothetical protein
MADYSSNVVSNPVSPHPEPINFHRHHHHHSVQVSDIHGSPSPPMSSGSNSEEDTRSRELKRPSLATKRTTSTIIVPRDTPNIEMTHEDYGPGDARSMSPRRTSEEVDRLGENARQALLQ